MTRFLAATITLLLLTACGPTFLVDEYQEVNASGWTYEEGKNFSFAVTDTQQLYALHLVVDHAPDFFSQNVYVEITTQRPDGSSQTDEVSLQLADKFGQWHGDCGTESCSLDILLQPIAFFDQPGTYQLTIHQHSRQPKLPGIQGLRFKMEVLEGKKSK